MAISNKTPFKGNMMWRCLFILLLLQFASSNCYPHNCDNCGTSDEYLCTRCKTDQGYQLFSPICCHNTCATCVRSGMAAICNCVYGHYLKSSEQRCYPCTNNMPRCKQCSSQNVCTACESLYAYNGSQCRLCSQLMPGCHNCTSKTVCTQCTSDTYGVNTTSSKCQLCSVLISGCSKCSSSTNCTACTGNTHIINLSTNTCDLCGTVLFGCLTCNSTACLTCANSTFAVNSSSLCAPCSTIMIGCITCSSSSVCLTCVNDSLAVDFSTKKCVPCIDLLTGCSNCNSYSSCTQCVNNTFALHVNATCNPCSLTLVGCLTCTSISFCQSCLNNSYVLNTGNNTCEACSISISSCLTCSSNTVCLSCEINTFLLNASTCATCGGVITDCLTCNSISVCTSCVNDSLTVSLSNDSCVACISFLDWCSNCNSSAICTACINDTFGVNSSSNRCVYCSAAMPLCTNCVSASNCSVCINNSYSVNSTFGCSPCYQLMRGCLYCNNSAICIQCLNTSFVMNLTSNRCFHCNSFMPFCAECNSSSTCTKCESNPKVIAYNGVCTLCSSLINGCQNCMNSTICTVCNQYYLYVAPGSCTSCQKLMDRCLECSSQINCTNCASGHSVINGCSSVPGCAAIENGNSKANCTACNSQFFHAQPSNGVCLCLVGHLAGEYCTEMIGCISINWVNSSDVCLFCDVSANFLLQNGTCICQPNYQLNGYTCTEICGDGKLIYLPCDDGNLIDGDGCSSTCQIQNGYKCPGGSINAKSKCVYRGLIKLQPVCIVKTEENTAKIVLTTVPFISNIVESSPTITFDIQKNCTMASYAFDGQNIVLSINFQQDIEGEYANIKISYDSNYIVSPNSSLRLELKQCNGDRLYYTTYTSKGMKTIINLNVKIMSAIVLFLWLIGSYSHKMIGVETLHTFQFILLPHALATRYFPVVVNFSELCNTLNFYQTMATSNARLSTKEQGRLCYSADVIYNNSIVFSVQLVILFVYFAFIAYAKIKKDSSKNTTESQKIIYKAQEKETIEKKYKFRRFLYDFLVFPTFIGFFLNVVFSLMIHSNNSHAKTVSLTIQALLIFFSLVCAAIIFFNEWKYFFVEGKEKDKTNKKKYVPLYLTFFICFCIIGEASLLSLLPSPLYVMLAVFFLFTILMIAYRPYHHWLHNTALIVNYIGVMLNICWVISQEYLYLSRQNEEMVAVALLIWIAFIFLLAILRIIYQIHRKWFSLNSKIKPDSFKDTKEDFHTNERKILQQILKQTLKETNSYRIQTQLLNRKLMQKKQFDKQRKKHIQFLHYRAIENIGVEKKYNQSKKKTKMGEQKVN